MLTCYLLRCLALVRVSIAAVKYHEEKQLGEERVIYLQFQIMVHHRRTSRQGLKAGTWKQEPKQKSWRNAAS